MRSHHLRLVTAACLAVAFGCDGGNHERDEPCDDSNACGDGLTCSAGACRASCNSGTDCPLGTGCSGGLCMPLAAGICGQAGDCLTPPDACRTAIGARCVQGRCEYKRANTLNCREECMTAASCVDAGPCRDPATARCVNTGCVYDARPDGTACDDGVCYRGSCVGCLGDGDCDPRAFGYDLCHTGAPRLQLQRSRALHVGCSRRRM